MGRHQNPIIRTPPPSTTYLRVYGWLLLPGILPVAALTPLFPGRVSWRPGPASRRTSQCVFLVLTPSAVTGQLTDLTLTDKTAADTGWSAEAGQGLKSATLSQGGQSLNHEPGSVEILRPAWVGEGVPGIVWQLVEVATANDDGPKKELLREAESHARLAIEGHETGRGEKVRTSCRSRYADGGGGRQNQGGCGLGAAHRTSLDPRAGSGSRPCPAPVGPTTRGSASHGPSYSMVGHKPSRR